MIRSSSPGSAPSQHDSTDRAQRVERIPAQRHAAILEHLRRVGAASVMELGDALRASHSTIRRDLDFLAERGYLERTHGGATLHGAAPEIESAISGHIFPDEKAAIGKLSVNWITPNMTVIFDSGTTTLEAARAVRDANIPLTAITNDLAIAQVLGAQSGISVIVPGGTLRSGSPTLLGSPGAKFLSSVHADLALIGTHAITGDLMTDSGLELAEMKRAMISAARQVLVLADSSKFGPPCYFDICRLDAVDHLICDDNLSAAARDELEAQGVAFSMAAAKT